MLNLLPGTTEQYALGDDPTVAKARNAEYAKAHFEYMHSRHPVTTFLCSIEIPEKGSFGRGKWTLKDDGKVAKLVAGALVPNKDGKIVPFVPNAHPFFSR